MGEAGDPAVSEEEGASPGSCEEDGDGRRTFDWVMEEDGEGGGVPVIASGAGHDALAMSEVTPIGMLFVRCRDGISHSPLEFVERKDVTVASLSMFHFLARETLVSRRVAA